MFHLREDKSNSVIPIQKIREYVQKSLAKRMIVANKQAYMHFHPQNTTTLLLTIRK
jgi:hypothetical protein